MDTNVLTIPELPKLGNLPVITLTDGGKDMLKKCNNLAVKDDTSLIIGNDYAGRINKAIKYVKKLRLDAARPINESLKEYKAQIEAQLAPFEEAYQKVCGEIANYRAIQQAEHDAKMEAARKEEERRSKISLAQGGTGEVKTPVAREIDPAILSPVSEYTAWEWKVVDERKIPLKYFVIDTVAINKEVRGGAREIPGIEIYSVKKQKH